MSTQGTKVGVEVGGTFTDLVAVQGEEVTVHKVPSTPTRPDEGAWKAIQDRFQSLAEIEDLSHGSTVATNAVLERRGANVAFVTSAGFRDILFIQRHDRHSIYDLRYQKPLPVVARANCFEVKERILPDGTVVQPLDADDVRADLVVALNHGKFDSVAVCLLNGYANPEHEVALAAMLREALPGLLVTCSSDVVREFREYERASTTVLSAFVQPVLDSYLSRFTQLLKTKNFAGRFSVMQSNGGRLPADAMRKNPITALFSGPAAGVIGATRQSAWSGFKNLITFDMGGTSTDVCLVEDGRPQLSPGTKIGGLPVLTPVLDIVTVGAGGGSIVWRDDGGMLRVGPRSAGAQPGPACYGRGGKEPTVTDAHVVCGTIQPKAFLGGRMTVDLAAARESFEPLAKQFGMSVEQVAEAAIRVADASIVRAIQIVTTERGKDPRDYALVAFGGAGPLHAVRVAEELGVKSVIIPPNAGILSAYGLVASDFQRYESISQKLKLDAQGTSQQLKEQTQRMKGSLVREFESAGLGRQLQFSVAADMRFVGQAFELTVNLDHAEADGFDRRAVEAAFLDAYRRVFIDANTLGRPVEIVALRVGATRALDQPIRLRPAREAMSSQNSAPVFVLGNWSECRRYAASTVNKIDAAAIPAVIEGATATTFVPQGWSGTRDNADNLVLRGNKA
jgi:N-methylhydantoinase A